MNQNSESDKKFLRRFREAIENDDDDDRTLDDEKRFVLIIIKNLLKNWCKGKDEE